MSTGIDKLASQLQKTINEKDKRKKRGYYSQSEVVRVTDDTVWVKIPGGIDETPVAKTVNAKPGDKVQVRVEGGRAWIAGNYTDPATGDSRVINLEKTVTKEFTVVKELVADKATIGQLRAAEAEIDDLTATKADISDLSAATARIGALEADHVSTNDLQAANAEITSLKTTKANISDLNAATARIGDLEADHVSVSDLNAATGRIGDLEADHVSTSDLNAATARIGTLETDNTNIKGRLTAAEADIDNVEADTAKIHNLTANQISATVGYIEDLTGENVTAQNIIADHATVGSLDSNYAHITNGTIDNAKIGYADVNDLNTHYAGIDLANVNNAWIENGVVKDAAISDAKIIGVSANKLTAGTIDASNITVTNLNADNITTGTINGQRIGTGSLSLDKLSEDVYTEAEVNTIVDGLNDRIDGAIETFTGTVVPTLNNAPANTWNTTKLKDQHIGDVYYVVNTSSDKNGYCYRFTKSGSTYSWQLIKDSDVTAALARLETAEGKIGNIETFDEEISAFKTTAEGQISSLQTKTTNLETSLGDKVSTATFNELSQTVDGNTASITSLTNTVNTKADSSTVTTLSNTVNEVSQTATSNSSKISNLTTVLGTNADGTTKAGDIVHRTSAVEQDLSGFKTTVSETYQTKSGMSNYSTTTQMNTAIQQSANAITASVEENYYTKSDTDDLLDDKADSSSVYTKSQIDVKVGEINTAVSAKADGAETTAALSLKANKAMLTSEINASADTVKINADKVNITGVITAINNDTTTTIDGGKITTGSITVGNVDSTIQNAVTTAQNTFIFDTSYQMNGTIASFEAHLYKGGVDVKEHVDGNNDPLYPPSMFTWYLKHEDSQTQQGDYIGSGYRINVNLSTCNYGAEVIAHFTTTEDSPLLNGDDDNLADVNNNNLTGRTESGESVRVRDLTVVTTLAGTDKLMVIGSEDEHLVSVQTLQDYLNANLDKQVKFNTTAGWNAQTSLVSQANTLYVYTDHQRDSQGNNVAGIKAGDGNAYVVDLPFTDAIATEHIADTTRHVTASERNFWNNKVRCYYASGDELIFTTA